MTALSSKVTIYVPSTVSVKTKANTTAWSNRIAKYLSANFGGATATKASGYWVSNSGELVKENVTLVYAYCTSKDLSLKKKRHLCSCSRDERILKSGSCVSRVRQHFISCLIALIVSELSPPAGLSSEPIKL